MSSLWSTSLNHTGLTYLLFFQEPIRPLEKRALNFLVNEYLLKNEYKLTSITFSDENDDQVSLYTSIWYIHFYRIIYFTNLILPVIYDIPFLQDFELWDDVGLNIPKPPDLLHLYRNCGNSLPLHRDTVNVAVSVDPSDLPGDYFTQEPVQQTEAIQVFTYRNKCWYWSRMFTWTISN